jgi:hypothetical protein
MYYMCYLIHLYQGATHLHDEEPGLLWSLREAQEDASRAGRFQFTKDHVSGIVRDMYAACEYWARSLRWYYIYFQNYLTVFNAIKCYS